jgi:2-oxoglutarate dehydrogenase E1 component
MVRDFRKPLIVFTPKKLLRFPSCVSPFEDLTTGNFQEVIDDPSPKNPENVDTVMFMSGKMYYEIVEQEKNYSVLENIALVRIEQISPIPTTQIKNILSIYKNAKKHFWVQEEPENMGAWTFMLRKFPDVKLEYIGRRESSAPAAGSSKRSEKRIRRVYDQIFTHAKTYVAK